MQKFIQTALIFSSRMAMPPTAAIRDRSSVTDTKQAPKKSNSHNSAAQMDVPHTHGVACWWCCWAPVFNVVLSACWLCSWLYS